VCGVTITMFTPTLGEHVLLPGLEHGKATYFFQVTRQSALRRENGKRGTGHSILLIESPFAGNSAGYPHKAEGPDVMWGSVGPL
jgi:hypothetical protein